jgi:predicted acetyltransferase
MPMDVKISLKKSKSLTEDEYKSVRKIKTSGVIVTYLDEYYWNDDTRVVIARVEEKIVGWLLAYDCSKTYCEVMLCVKKKFRKKGIGTLMMKKLQEKYPHRKYKVSRHDNVSERFFNSIKNMKLV